MIKNIQILYQSGHYEEAKATCLQSLNAQPKDAHVLDLLGLTYLKTGDLDNAMYSIQSAIEIDDQEPLFCLHLAHVMKAKGLYSETFILLKKAIKQFPDFAPLYNNLGALYFEQAKWDEAIFAYQAALDLKPDYAETYYNLGLAYSRLSQFTHAITAYEALLLLFPSHQGAHFQLGCIYMQLEQYERAISHFISIEQDHFSYVEAKSNLAACFLKLGLLHQAQSHYLAVRTKRPNDTQVLFNLGVINMQQGAVRDAIRFYQEAIKIKPDFYDAHYNLSVAYLAIKDKAHALEHFCEVLRAYPDNQAVMHTVRILKQEKNMTGSPHEYIISLFDSYADHYDAHLENTLSYQVPEAMYEAVHSIVSDTDYQWNILDLGCGTGQCGRIFKPMARFLQGVDLSGEMLKIALTKNIYDSVTQSDILDFLKNQQTAYDLILAGDVLVYSGDLEAVFALVSTALKLTGLFVFTTEMCQNGDYEITSSGRFTHHTSYLNQLALKYHFSILLYKTIVLRRQDGKDVFGHLYLLKRSNHDNN